MPNFKKETINFMNYNNIKISDIEWVGSRDGYIPIDEFFEKIDFEYDNGYGTQEIAQDLIIVGENFIMARSEYDGAEGWECHWITPRPKYRLKEKEYKIGGHTYGNLFSVLY